MTKPENIAAIAVMAVVAAVASAKTTEEEIKELKAEIKSNSVDRTVKSRYYLAWYSDLCTSAEREAIVERNIAAHRRWIELEPSNPAPRCDLGAVYAAVERWSDAKKELAIAIAAGDKLDKVRRAVARYEMANCQWAEGDIEGAKKLIAELAAMEWDGHVPYPCQKAVSLYRSFTDPDADLDMLKLPHSVDCKPFPTPQEAKYGSKKVSLAKVEIKFRTNGTEGTNGTSPVSRISPVSPADPIIRLLKRKLARFGAKFEKGGTPMEIELSPDAPVGKPEGYSLDIANGKVTVKARSRIGLTWGVVSLLQCVDRDELSVCECEIRDWPTMQKRGALPCFWWEDFIEYALFSKMSSVSMHLGRMGDEDCWTLSPIDRERLRLCGERYAGFGITLYSTTRHVTLRPVLALASPRTWELHLAWSRLLAAAGIGNSFHLDDERYPLRDMDLKEAGVGANIDAKYLTRLYREVKSEYPDFKMQFCPPFYWGPDSPTSYPEPREPYLKSLGEFLDPEIEVHWTGPRVKSENMTPDRADWYARLIGRKPTVFHNGDCIGRHNFIQYGADPSGYKASHAPDIFDHLESFQSNMSNYFQTPEVYSSMDWCWNPTAHDPETAVRRSVEIVEGPCVPELLAAATPNLAYFDKYRYGEPRGELFVEDADDLDRRVAEARLAWKKLLSIAKNGGRFVRGFKTGLGWAEKLAEYRRNPPKWLVERQRAAMANVEFAKKEVGFDEAKEDKFFPAETMAGGMFWTGIGDKTDRGRRDVKELVAGAVVTGKFDCAQFPPPRPYKMIVSGLQFLDVWERPHKAQPPAFEVEVNGRVIWKGNAFEPDAFTTIEVDVPPDALFWSNTFTIRNVGPAVPHQSRPMIHYVVIRK